MADNNLYKIIGFLTAIFLYIISILVVVGVISANKKIIKDYGFDVEKAIVIDISDEKPAPKQRVQPKKRPKEKPKPVVKNSPKPIVLPPDPEPKPKPVHQVEPIILPPDPDPKPEPKPEPEPEVHQVEPVILPPDPEPIPNPQPKEESRDKVERSVKDLFSTVRTDKFDKVMSEREKTEAARASRLKKRKAEDARKKAQRIKKEKARRKAQQQAKRLMQQLQATKSSNKKRGEIDDFWSPVSNRIMSKWNRTISTQDGLKASVKIRINSRGKLSYRNLRLSGDQLFDHKLKVFLENLQYDKFPAYRKGSYIEATFEFKDKEESL
jgi:hypothetical protein